MLVAELYDLVASADKLLNLIFQEGPAALCFYDCVVLNRSGRYRSDRILSVSLSEDDSQTTTVKTTTSAVTSKAGKTSNLLLSGILKILLSF